MRVQLIGFIFFCWVTLVAIITHAGAGIAIPVIFAIAFLISWLIRRARLKDAPPE